MSGPYILLQFGDNPCHCRFEDLESRAAFTIQQVFFYRVSLDSDISECLAVQIPQDPNLVVRVRREDAWSQQHPAIMGPDRSFLYFGPGNTQGYLVYGNSASQPMANSLRQKRDSSQSKYFKPQNGSKEYKWKINGPQRMECSDGRALVAVWELSEPEDDFHARLTIKGPGLAIVTEILTTLTLNRVAQALSW
ncbi:hypothetical protein ONZ45_g17412 [Pleurotus djamor]|nr:hypothetical protein ONZ45_g17412 [Pleurotus djamor]